MKQNIIEKLRKARPEQRAVIMQNLLEKNMRYFEQNHPAVAAELQRLPCPYEARITKDFIRIVHKPTGELCHPEVGLDLFSEALGDWTHKAWIDLVDPRLRSYNEKSRHKDWVENFQDSLEVNFPQYRPRFTARQLDLPETEGNRRFSNPVLFLGVFHGLHIAHYLSRTDVRSVAFVEPDIERFCVSLYFLDYLAIEKRFNGLLLHIGDRLPDPLFESLATGTNITTPVWLRILPGYASERNESFMINLRTRWNGLKDSWFSGDMELRGFQHMATNLKDKRQLLSSRPKLSNNSKIVAVGAGPSLSDDIDWLKRNRDRVIVFAVHSAIRALHSHGIEADYQFSLDLEVNEESLQGLQLNPNVPMVADCKCIPEFLSQFRCALMVPSAGNPYPVRLSTMIPGFPPTTGNLMLSVAVFCQPAELYLLGMDLGYRNKKETHVAGSYYDHVEGMHESIVSGSENLTVPANFPEREPVFTRGYFNEARLQAENALALLPEGCRAYNLSDGAAIVGAPPWHSAEIELSDYLEKAEDMAAFQAAFAPSASAINWRPMTRSGEDLLQDMQDRFLGEFQLEEFSWQNFTWKLDRALLDVTKSLRKENPDIGRLSPYYRIIKDILLGWYRIMVFAQDETEAHRLYDSGMVLLRQTVEEFSWPEELDDLVA